MVATFSEAEMILLIWVRMSTQYASSSTMRCNPRTCPSIRLRRFWSFSLSSSFMYPCSFIEPSTGLFLASRISSSRSNTTRRGLRAPCKDHFAIPPYPMFRQAARRSLAACQHFGLLLSVVGAFAGHRILLWEHSWGKEVRLRYGFVIPTGDPRTVAELAREMEEAGWDGAFYWDGICVGEMATFDPWVVMAAMAMCTERVRIGAVLTPPARRRPWKLARETVALDHLSGGRLVLPVGLGALDDGGFSRVGEPTDKKVRAQLLDESLEILTGLWSGEPFSYGCEDYRLEEMTFLPPPVQKPRIRMGGRSVAEQEVDGAGVTLRWDACGHSRREWRIAGRYARDHPRDQGVRRGEQRRGRHLRHRMGGPDAR